MAPWHALVCRDQRSAQSGDGSASLSNAPNGLTDPSEVSEHRGRATMFKGFFMTFRNPTAHAPKVRWALDEADAFDMLAQASTFHRRLDSAIVTPAAPAYRQHTASV
jgi:hypothetical protein